MKIVILIFVLIMSGSCITSETIADCSKEIFKTVYEDISTDEDLDILQTAQKDISTVDEDSFTNLCDELEEKRNCIDYEYTFNNETDAKKGLSKIMFHKALKGQKILFNVSCLNTTIIVKVR